MGGLQDRLLAHGEVDEDGFPVVRAERARLLQAAPPQFTGLPVVVKGPQIVGSHYRRHRENYSVFLFYYYPLRGDPVAIPTEAVIFTTKMQPTFAGILFLFREDGEIFAGRWQGRSFSWDNVPC